MVFTAIFYCPCRAVTMRRSSIAMIHSTVSESICLDIAAALIDSNPVLSNAPSTSINAASAISLYLKEFSILRTRWCYADTVDFPVW